MLLNVSFVQVNKCKMGVRAFVTAKMTVESKPQKLCVGTKHERTVILLRKLVYFYVSSLLNIKVVMVSLKSVYSLYKCTLIWAVNSFTFRFWL